VTGLKETQDLYYLDWKHSGELPGGWNFKADIEYADDKLFFEEFGETADQYNRDETVSTLILQRNWQKLNLVGYARYLKDLDKSNDMTLQTLPEVGLSLARYRLGETPLYASLESYATHFSRRDGQDGERLLLRPALSAALKPGGWLELVPEVAWYERLYNVDSAADEEGGVAEFSLVASTRLIKVYDFERWGVDRVQHSIEPKVTYRYISDENQDDLPLFDLFDRISGENEVEYSLVNRLTARSTAEDGSKVYREVFNLRFSQSYDVDEARNNTSGEGQPFSDLRFELDLSPNPYLSFDVDGLMPVYGGNRLNRLSAGSTVSDDAGNSAKVNYVYRDEEYASTGRDYLRLQLKTSIVKPLYVKFEDRYDFREGRELEKTVGLEYRAKCWSLLLTYRNRYRDDGDDDHEVGIAFVLSGLGQTPGLGGGFSAVDR
jgi:LPS-assembly protein